MAVSPSVLVSIKARMRLMTVALHELSLAFMTLDTRHRHKRRCRYCTPFANPVPLPFDGHAYRRRTKRR